MRCVTIIFRNFRCTYMELSATFARSTHSCPGLVDWDGGKSRREVNIEKLEDFVALIGKSDKIVLGQGRLILEDCD